MGDLAPQPTVYAYNVKAQGKVHRVLKQYMKVSLKVSSLHRATPRVACGWRITKSVSLIYNSSKRPQWGELCTCCFPAGVETQEGSPKTVEPPAASPRAGGEK